MKRKYILILLFFIIFTYFFSVKVLAHPMDVSYAEFYLNDRYLIKTEMYISWAQILTLVDKTTDNMDFIDFVNKTLNDHKNLFAKYLKNNIIVTNNKSICDFQLKEITNQDKMRILFGRGVKFSADYRCKEEIKDLTIVNTLFIDKFPKQTNNMVLFDQDKKIIRRTALNSRDTNMNIFLVEKIEPLATANPKKEEKNKILENINRNLDGSLAVTCFMVFLLGMLHTLEAGHSKSILASLLLDKRVNLHQGIIYAVVFTITHISDILILSILFLFVNSFTNLYTKLPYLQILSGWLLLIVSLILFFKTVFKTLIGVEKNHNHSYLYKDFKKSSYPFDFKKQLFLGFLTGIAPCLFGWSIFLIILTTHKIWTVLLIIPSFGLGIFTALVLVILIVSKFKSIFYNRLTFLGKWSPVISSSLLVFFALKIIFNL